MMCDQVAIDVARKLMAMGKWRPSIVPTDRGTCIVEAMFIVDGKPFTIQREIDEYEAGFASFDLAEALAQEIHAEGYR